MKKQLLSVMLLAGALLVGCQSNSVEPVEPTEEVVVNEQDAEEAERQAHIDEIRKSINGEQEEMTTEEYFEQQREQERKEKSEEAIASAHNWREYNDIIVDGFPDTKEEEKEKPREKTYLETISEIRREEIKRGLTYENFLLVGTVDFNSLYAVNQLFGEGELIGERGNIQQYRWTSGSGGDYKVVQVMFVDGQVESKSQSGLK